MYPLRLVINHDDILKTFFSQFFVTFDEDKTTAIVLNISHLKLVAVNILKFNDPVMFKNISTNKQIRQKSACSDQTAPLRAV